MISAPAISRWRPPLARSRSLAATFYLPLPPEMTGFHCHGWRRKNRSCERQDRYCFDLHTDECPVYFPCSFQQSTHVDLAASELLAPLRVPVSHSARLGITSGKFGELDLLPVLSSDPMNSSKVRTFVLPLLLQQASCHLYPRCIIFHKPLI